MILPFLLVLSTFAPVRAQDVNVDPNAVYTVSLARGKNADCNPPNIFLSNLGCGAGKTLQDLFNKDDGSKNQHYTFVPVSGMTNTFNIKNNCGQFLSCQTCAGQATTDLFDKDDASGRQRWTLVPVPNASNTYNIKVAGGREETCGVFLSTGAGCNDNFVDLFTKDDGSGRQQWVLNRVGDVAPSRGSSTASSGSSTTSASASPTSTSAAGPPLPTDGPAVTLDSSVFYTVTLAKGKADGCNPLNNMFSNQGCDRPIHDLYFKDDGSKNQYWRFVPVKGTNNVFNILSSCSKYLSCQACNGTTTTDLFSKDDGSGRQRWFLTPVNNSTSPDTYTIRVAGGRDPTKCGTFISTAVGCNDNFVDLFTRDDGSGRQQWVVKPVQGDLGTSGKLPLVPPKYIPLPLGAIKPTSDSWLFAQLKAQADGLHGHLQDFWPFVKTSNWVGGTDDYSDLKLWFFFALDFCTNSFYPMFSEAGSFWLNGVVSTAFQLNDQRLLDSVNSWVDYILSHQGSDGWLGPTGPDGKRVLWGRYPALLALMSYAQANTTSTTRVVDSLQKFFIGMNDMLKNGGDGLEEWGIMRWYEPGIVLYWLIENHPNGQEATYENVLKLLKYGGANWKAYFTDASFPKTAINAVDIRGHGVNIGQAIKSEAIAYRYSHDTSDLDSTRTRVDLIEKYHGSVSGVLKADEHLAGLHPSRGSELCTVVESMHSYEYAYSVMGDNAFADKVERLAFNALPGMFIEDMWGHQYLQQSNQPWAKSMDPRVFATDGPDSAIYGLAPNYPCCTVNHGQGWPKFISHAYMTSSDRSTLHHVLLSPTTVNTTLAGDNKVTVTSKTNYPFNSRLDYTTFSDKPFNFGIRAPTWVSGTITYSVDGGSSQNGSPDSSGYVVVNVSGGSHQISVTIPMTIQTEERFNRARAVIRGPLVYSVELGYNPMVIKSYNFGNSKDWQLDPSSTWQIAIDPSTLVWNGDGDTNSTNLGGSVFTPGGAPVSISANTCQISWNVVTNAADTPPTSPASCTGMESGVKLIPYGAAKLRMSELPSFKSGSGSASGGGGGGNAGGGSKPNSAGAVAVAVPLVTVLGLGLCFGFVV